MYSNPSFRPTNPSQKRRGYEGRHEKTHHAKKSNNEHSGGRYSSNEVVGNTETHTRAPPNTPMPGTPKPPAMRTENPTHPAPPPPQPPFLGANMTQGSILTHAQKINKDTTSQPAPN